MRVVLDTGIMIAALITVDTPLIKFIKPGERSVLSYLLLNGSWKNFVVSADILNYGIT